MARGPNPVCHYAVNKVLLEQSCSFIHILPIGRVQKQAAAGLRICFLAGCQLGVVLSFWKQAACIPWLLAPFINNHKGGGGVLLMLESLLPLLPPHLSDFI